MCGSPAGLNPTPNFGSPFLSLYCRPTRPTGDHPMKFSNLSACVLLAAGASFGAHAQTTLTVYSALEADQMRAYQTAFEKQNPDVKIQWVRDSTGIITAKLLAEKNNPQA